MATFRMRYGGGRGPQVVLATSPNALVVRTHARTPLDDTPLPEAARRALSPFRRHTFFRHAGVEILAPAHPRVTREARDQARRVLKQTPQIRFAGRVLIDQASRSPVAYTENFFVKFVGSARPSQCRAVLKEHGLEVKREVDYAENAYFVAAPEGTGTAVFDIAERLLAHEDVELCHPEVVRERAFRAAFPPQWHLMKTVIGGVTVDAHVDVVAAWTQVQGEGTTIAVIDDGFDVAHPEFAVAGKVVAARDETLNSADARPKYGSERHGTACAGVACAAGVVGAAGVAPKSKLMPIRLASALGSQDEADAFVWAARNGADVISCSWGPADGRWWDASDPTHRQVVPLPDSTRTAIDWAVRNGRGGKGCVICWAAGNGNEPVENDGYASYEKVIAVAACNDSGRRSVYSDHGAPIFCSFPSGDFEGLGNPAPRTPGIWTVDRAGADGYNPGSTARGDAAGHFTNSFGGTSSAAPGAAGVAALVIAANPALRWDEVRDVLRRCCDRIDPTGGAYDATGRSRKYGFGRLNAKKAVQLAVATTAPAPTTLAATATGARAIRDFAEARLSVNVTDLRPIRRARVTVSLLHTWVGDLVISLVPPSSAGMLPIVLRSRVGRQSTGLTETYDRASAPGLGALVGKSAAGRWTLSVYDAAAEDVGTLTSFRLELDV